MRRSEVRAVADRGVAGEVVPTDPRRAAELHTALRQRGFRILHVGPSISVEAPRTAWETTFGASFTPHTKTVQKEIGRQRTYLRADPGSVRVPIDLQDLIAEVAIMEPPELH